MPSSTHFFFKSRIRAWAILRMHLDRSRHSSFFALERREQMGFSIVFWGRSEGGMSGKKRQRGVSFGWMRERLCRMWLFLIGHMFWYRKEVEVGEGYHAEWMRSGIAVWTFDAVIGLDSDSRHFTLQEPETWCIDSCKKLYRLSVVECMNGRERYFLEGRNQRKFRWKEAMVSSWFFRNTFIQY